MRLFKTAGINIIIFLVYALLISVLTEDSWEGFALSMYFILCLTIHLLIILVLTIIAAIKKSLALKPYVFSLVLMLLVSVVVYLVLE